MTQTSRRVSARAAAPKGGAATLAKYGPDYYRRIGQRGGLARARAIPHDAMRAIGRKGGLTRAANARCDKRAPKQPSCAVLIHTVACGECGEPFTRCELHGGSKSANLALFHHVRATGHRRYV